MTEPISIVLETVEERLWTGDSGEQLNRVNYRLLLLFIEREGKLVTKRDILRNVWPDTNVSDASVKDSVKNLRATLGDSAAKPTFIETVRGRGYRFLGGIDVVERVMAKDATTPIAESRPAELMLLDPAPKGKTVKKSGRFAALVAAACVAAVVLALALFWHPQAGPVPARKDRIAFAIPEKPSIAVTPFANANDNSDIGWLSTGLSANVITALASSPDMVVISQNALDAMRDVKPGEIAERYGVRYVLDGTIQIKGEKLRISARLADAIAGRTLWSETWNQTLDDIFEIQDEIADAILEELQVRLTIGEQARSWRVNLGSAENMRDLVVGRVAFQTFTPQDHDVATRLWNGIYKRNPELPFAMALQGWLHWHKVLVRVSTDPLADLTAAKDWAQKAIDAGLGGNPHVLYAASAHYLGESEKALEYAEQGILSAPGEADVIQIAGFVFAEDGRLQEGINLMQRGMRLEPDYPDWLAGTMVVSFVKAGRWQDAKDLAKDMIKKDVKDVNAMFSALISLVVLSVWQNEPAATQTYLASLLAMRPGLTVDQVVNTTRYFTFANFIEDPDYHNRYLAALRAAGLPEGE